MVGGEEKASLEGVKEGKRMERRREKANSDERLS